MLSRIVVNYRDPFLRGCRLYKIIETYEEEWTVGTLYRAKRTMQISRVYIMLMKKAVRDIKEEQNND